MISSIIPPIPELYLAKGRNFHLVLSHLMGNSAYYSFYLGESLRGSYITLDNSAHEKQVGERIEKLYSQAVDVNADEIVLPDRLFFGEDTFELSDQAMAWLKSSPDFRNRPLNLMVVPQGRTHLEFEKCCNALVEAFRVRFTNQPGFENVRLTVGLSKDYEEFEGGLPRIIEKVILPSIDMLGDIPIHLLGWGRKLWEVGEIHKSFGSFIRSIDSAKPLVFGLAGIKLDPERGVPKYPKRTNGGEYFKESIRDEEIRRIVLHNINIYDQTTQGEVTWNRIDATAAPSGGDPSSPDTEEKVVSA